MKKTVKILVAAVLMAMGTHANAQSVLGTLGNVLSSAASSQSSTSTSSSSSSSLVNGLVSILSSKLAATEDQIVGTWTYEEPAIVFTSDNVLQKYGGKVAAAAIEKKLQTKLEKYGIKKGKMTMTFDKDGNFTQTVSGKTVKGTYTISGSNVNLKYAGQVSQVVGTTQIEDGDLLIVMDASKLLSYMKTLGKVSSNSTLKNASSLISGFNGMKCGLRLSK